jgi:hypothetical protein
MTNHDDPATFTPSSTTPRVMTGASLARYVKYHPCRATMRGAGTDRTTCGGQIPQRKYCEEVVDCPRHEGDAAASVERGSIDTDRYRSDVRSPIP